MAKLKGKKKSKKSQLQLASDALYPSYGDSWKNEIDGYKDPKSGDVLFNEKELPGGDKQLGFEFLVKQLLIKRNKKLAGVLLPGETPAGGKGGLGSMNRDQLERWIKENGITGPGADKIRNKWKNLGPNLPLAHNMKPGPASGIADQIMIQQQKLYNSGKPGDKKKALELLKIHADMINLPKA